MCIRDRSTTARPKCTSGRWRARSSAMHWRRRDERRTAARRRSPLPLAEGGGAARAAGNPGGGSPMSEVIPVREQHRIDEAALAGWMAAHVPGFRGPLRIDQFAGGQSNPTYRLRTPEASYVLRRKPPGELLKGAHAIEREARVMAALAGTGFPVPKVHGLCEDAGVIGSAFFVMDLVEGRIFWDASFSELPREQRAAHMDAMNATIAALHGIDPAAVGLDDF